MNQSVRFKLLSALTTKMDEALDETIDGTWGIIHVPQELGHLMALAALHVVDIVIATEDSLDADGLLAVDENGVAVA